VADAQVVSAAWQGGLELTHNPSVVMLGLVPGIRVLRATSEGVDGRDKPGHDGLGDSTQTEDAPKAAAFLDRRPPC
jgi:hypothetical protein